MNSFLSRFFAILLVIIVLLLSIVLGNIIYYYFGDIGAAAYTIIALAAFLAAITGK